MENRVFTTRWFKPEQANLNLPDDPFPAESERGSRLPDAFRNPSALLRSYPAVTVGIGLCAGIALGWWVKRR